MLGISLFFLSLFIKLIKSKISYQSAVVLLIFTMDPTDDWGLNAVMEVGLSRSWNLEVEGFVCFLYRVL